MESLLADNLNFDDLGQETPRFVSGVQFLYLALNDVVAFERAVLATGRKFCPVPQAE